MLAKFLGAVAAMIAAMTSNPVSSKLRTSRVSPANSANLRRVKGRQARAVKMPLT